MVASQSLQKVLCAIMRCRMLSGSAATLISRYSCDLHTKPPPGRWYRLRECILMCTERMHALHHSTVRGRPLRTPDNRPWFHWCSSQIYNTSESEAFRDYLYVLSGPDTHTMQQLRASLPARCGTLRSVKRNRCVRTMAAVNVQQLKKAKEQIRDIITGAHCNPILVRLGWHDSGTYSKVRPRPALPVRLLHNTLQ